MSVHYHACNRDDCGEDRASDGIEVSVWITAPGGVNVVTWADLGDWETAAAYAAESNANGHPAIVMVRDVVKTGWRKPHDGELE